MGKNMAIDFLPDGTVWYYSTDKKSNKGTYKISTNGTMINVNDSVFDNYIAVSGNYLFIGGATYMRID